MEESKTTILFVDDEESERYAVGRILRQEGFEVREAATGEETLRLAMEAPDLVLLDVRLPDLNGFEICRRLKDSPHTRDIPVLLLTATYYDDESRLRGFQSGADGYLTQPLDPAVLVAHIKSLLRSRNMFRRSAECYRMIIDSLPTGVCIIQNEKIQLVNERFAKLMESGKEELVGMTSADIAHPEDRELLQKETARSLSGAGPSRGFEIRLIGKGGNIHRVEVHDVFFSYDNEPAVLRNVVEIVENVPKPDYLKQ